MDPKVKAILQKKFGKTQTGGKGSMRRKRKNTKSKLINTRLTPEEKNFINMIQNANIAINSLQGDKLHLWNSYFKDWLFDTVMEFRKKDFNKKSEVNALYFQEYYDEIFNLEFLEEKNKRMLFKNSYKYCKKIFSPQGYDYMLTSLEQIPKTILKQDYIHTGEKKEVENVNELLELLELKSEEIPTKSDLKKAFLKKSTKIHPDKHPNEIEKYSKLFQEINEAYKNLLSYYHGENNDHLYTL
jgi:hypothetical protein